MFILANCDVWNSYKTLWPYISKCLTRRTWRTISTSRRYVLWPRAVPLIGNLSMYWYDLHSQRHKYPLINWAILQKYRLLWIMLYERRETHPVTPDIAWHLPLMENTFVYKHPSKSSDLYILRYDCLLFGSHERRCANSDCWMSVDARNVGFTAIIGSAGHQMLKHWHIISGLCEFNLVIV